MFVSNIYHKGKTSFENAKNFNKKCKTFENGVFSFKDGF